MNWIQKIVLGCKYLIQDDENGVSELITFIYDEDTLCNPTVDTLQDKAIDCHKNDTTDVINTQVFSLLPGDPVIYHFFIWLLRSPVMQVNEKYYIL